MKRLFWAFIVLSIQLNVFAYERPLLQEGNLLRMLLNIVYMLEKIVMVF